MVKIKMCGLMSLKDIEIVNRYKPDYVGFVFAESKRKVSYSLAYQMKQKLSEDIISVGVFVNPSQEEVLKLFDEKIFEVVQLHGDESEDFINNLKEKSDNKLKIIKAVEISRDADLKRYDDSKADYLLLDSGKGSGKTFNWNVFNEDIKKDFFIAGGINISNIHDAIRKFNPYAVDLSSGLESDGVKDENKIKEIMGAIN